MNRMVLLFRVICIVMAMPPSCPAQDFASGSSEDVNVLLQNRAHVNIEPSSIPSKVSHSDHSCHGGDSMVKFGVKETVKEQTCLFKNVCFDPKLEQFLYFASDVQKLTQDDNSADNGIRNGSIMVHLRPHGQYPFQYMEPVPMEFVVLQRRIPKHAKMYDVDVSVLMQPVGSENFGHELSDDMFSIYQMLKLFHVKDSYASQVLMLKDCDQFNLLANGRPSQNRAGCEKLISKLFPAISSRSVKTLLPKSRPGVLHNESLVCFPHLIVGAGPLGMGGRREGKSNTIWEFRNYMLANLNVKPKGKPIRILVSQKSESIHPSKGLHIENAESLTKELQAKFTFVMLVDFATMSLYDQAQLLADTAVLISHPGGGSFVGLFLPPGATLVVTTDKDGYKFHPENEPDIWSNLYWMQVRWVPGNTVDPKVLIPLIDSALARTHQFQDPTFAW